MLMAIQAGYILGMRRGRRNKTGQAKTGDVDKIIKKLTR
jgi:hypothetical protein